MAMPVKRDTLPVVAMLPGAQGAQVFEVIPPIFDLLAALDDWIAPKRLGADLHFARCGARGALAHRSAPATIFVVGKFPAIASNEADAIAVRATAEDRLSAVGRRNAKARY